LRTGLIYVDVYASLTKPPRHSLQQVRFFAGGRQEHGVAQVGRSEGGAERGGQHPRRDPAAQEARPCLEKAGPGRTEVVQGSILQNSISAEKLSDTFLPSNFGLISTKNQQIDINLFEYN
jgi:hypothetical protein